jgi:P27 family predicted phage terminase small subunit
MLGRRGSWRGIDRPDDPEAERGLPEVQFHDENESKQVFEQVSELLDSMGLLYRTDGFPLERYCRMLVRWRRAEAFIERYGEVMTYKDEKTGRIERAANPEVSIAGRLNDALRRMEAEFGLTPSARTRIAVTTGKQEVKPTLETYKLA